MSSLPDLMTFDLLTSSAIPEQLLTASRANAEAVGYANGWSQGLREAHSQHAGEKAAAERRIQEIAARHAEALQSATFALHEAAGQLEQRSIASYNELSEVILAAAVEIAEALLGAQLQEPLVGAAAALGRVLAMVAEDEPVTVKLSASDHEALTATDDFAQYASGSRSITLQIDSSLEPGDALGFSGATTVDARLSQAVVRLKEHLQR
jgi:flagellar assembly protein FliH